MTEQREKPDFVVDPSGAAEDVQRIKYASSQVPPGGPPGNGRDGQLKSYSPQRPKRTFYLIPIPIGLIIFLLVSLVRCLNSPEKNAHTFDSQNAYREYSRGNRYLFSGDYDKAIIHFNMALHSESDVGDIYNSRGLVYEAKGDHNRAIADFSRALELMAESAMVYNNRAITYHEMGNYDQAIADLDRAIELQPNLGKAYYNRGLACLALGDYNRAIADLDQAIQRSSHWFPISTSEPSDSGLGLLGGFDEELEAMRYAAPLPSAHYNRGLAYLAKGEYDSAIADLREAVQLQPDLSEAQNVLTLAYAAIAQTPSAQTAPGPSPMGTASPEAADRVLASKTTTAAPTGEPPVPIAAYVPQSHETPTTPIWGDTQVSCQGKALSGSSSPGTYLYRITNGSSGRDLVVEQKTGNQEPIGFSCALLGVDITSSSHNFGESLTGSFTGGTSRTLSGCLPEGALGGRSEMSIAIEGIEPKTTELGVFQAVRVDINIEYSFTTGLHRTVDMAAQKSEWYACGYGLVHSTASSAGKESGMNLPPKSSEVTLISYTPISTNESHVRHILVDTQLSNNINSYRANITDEETAEAVRRWDAGIRVVNIAEFARMMINGQWHIVYVGTRDPIRGTDVILTTDASP